MFGFDRITFDPQVMGGRACIRGMRITVSLIVNLVASGMTVEQIMEDIPTLILMISISHSGMLIGITGTVLKRRGFDCCHAPTSSLS